MRSNARSFTLSSTVDELSGRKLQRRAHAYSPRRRSMLAGWIDSRGIRQSPARTHSFAVASRRAWYGSTPLSIDSESLGGPGARVASRGGVAAAAAQAAAAKV